MAIVPFVPDEQQQPGRFVPDAQQQPPSAAPKTASVMRTLGLETKYALGRTARIGAEAVGAIPMMAADLGVGLRNIGENAFAGRPLMAETHELPSRQYQRGLDQIGLPRPRDNVVDKVTDVAGQMMFGSRLPVPTARTSAPANFVPAARQAATAPARTLEAAGVPLDRAQRSGGKFMQMLRATVSTHPATVDKAAAFTNTQQRAFNRAVLRSIGAEADEATQPVMAAAYNRIGNIFNGIGRQGARFDDTLQSEIASIVDDALRTVPQSALQPLSKNVDDILNAVDKSGRISGEQFIKIRSHLSALSDNADVGAVAEKLETAMLHALQRSHPGQRQILQNAIDQWRNMRIIQTAVGRGAERNISPLALSNAIGNRSNQAMSVYGQGGDQGLVTLAQAGRSVLPEGLSNSGTVPRGLMVMPLRAVATAPLYRGAQNYLMRQPLPPGGGVLRNSLLPASAVGVNALYDEENR